MSLFKDFFKASLQPDQVDREKIRVAAFVDTMSLERTPVRLYQSRVDLIALKEFIANGRTLSEAHAFVAHNAAKDPFGAFYKVLRKAGYDVHSKDRPEAHPGILKTVWSAEIIETLKNLPIDADVVAVVGTDPSYAGVLAHLMLEGKKIELIAFPQDLHPDFDIIADCIRPLTEDILMKRQKIGEVA